MTRECGWHSLAVGVNTYFTSRGEEDRSARLEYAAADARRMARAVRVLSPEVKSRLVTDEGGSITRPTRNEIFVSLEKAINLVPRESPFLFYFAGHGVSEDGRWYICPTDFDSRVPTRSGISLFDVLEIVQRHKGRKLIVTDCCRINVERPTSYRRIPFRDFGALPADQKTIMVTSCSDSQYAFETIQVSRCGGGVFTHYLCESIRYYARQRDLHPVTLRDVFTRAREKTSGTVAEIVETRNQTPQILGGDPDDWALIQHTP